MTRSERLPTIYLSHGGGPWQHAGFAVASNPKRGFDRGTFVPMMLALPRADVPCCRCT